MATAREMSARRAQASTLMRLMTERYHVTKNISDSGVTLSMVLLRANCRLNFTSSSLGDNSKARS